MGTINYTWKENPGRKEGQKRFHVRVANNSATITFKEVCKSICNDTSATEADVKSVTESLSHLLSSHLSEGRSVHLEGIGYFSVAISAPTFDDPKELHANQLKLRTVDFKPDKELMGDISKDLHFHKANKGERSVELTDYAIRRLLTDYFENHQCITAQEFRMLFNQTKSTAYRRLKELCKGPRPILKRMGGARSSVYVMG